LVEHCVFACLHPELSPIITDYLSAIQHTQFLAVAAVA
jgi:hypothetical protein